MRARCYNPKLRGYHNYGGRGITVDKAWRESFTTFYQDVGPRPGPGYTLDRIDNAGNYEPGNCRWATKTEQANNTRRTHILTFDGQTLPLGEWAKIKGISRIRLWDRLNRGWSLERALNQAPDPDKQRAAQSRW